MSRLLTLFMILASGLSAQERLSPELLWKLGRVSGGQISPDGAQVLYSVRRYELSKNSGDSDLYVVPLEGGDARRLTSGPESESEAQWVQTPRGLRIYFLSRRAGQEATQAWSLDPATGDLLQVTDLAGGIANLKVAPGGRRMAFTVDVKLDATVPELFADLPQADARIIDGLMYRHWNAWHDYAYSHLHVAAIGDDGHAAAATDLMRNLRVDCPVPPFSGSEQIAWSPDGEWIAYTMKMAADWAQSTDSDVYLSRWDGSGERRCVSEANTGYDNDPSFSPDGTKLAWHSMERAGFESDRNRIMVL
ncbi:MAG: PD40 domain-containing protein, partial [Planctomycetes bacterium]|nr:PD40 domain-containing protein [Planctomycetota bacterium]